MSDEYVIPEIGKTCPALTDEYYDYKLSGDAYTEHCRCAINGEKCVGFVIRDVDDQSSQFFSRGKNFLDPKKIKKCPLYGMSKKTFKTIIKERAEREMNEKIDKIK